MPVLKFRIAKNGQKVTVEGDGFSGEGCLETSKKFMERLGQTESTNFKSEYYDEQVDCDINTGY